MKKKFLLYLLYYFRFLAKLQLKKYAPDIIGITGSAGKTTTRNAIGAVLQDKYEVRISEKANSESGIPLNILGLYPNDYSTADWLRLALAAPMQLAGYWQPHDKYVVEMGIDSYKSPKNMEYLLTIVRPRTAVFLNAEPAHSYAFDEINPEQNPAKRFETMKQLIASEKGKLITSLPENGLAILNADDPNVIAFKLKTKAQVMTFGKHPSCDVQIKSITRSSNSTSFVFSVDDESVIIVLPYLLADHYAYSLAAAICIGIDEAMSPENIKRSLEKNFKLEPGRMSLFDGINGSAIIDSSYNASPEPTIDALTMLSAVPAKRKLALLGDMRELGEQTAFAHQQIMDVAMKSVDELILVGPLMEQYALPYLTKQKYHPVAWFDSAAKAASYLKGVLEKGDIVLVKGSQNTIFLEIAVEALLARKNDAAKLCRRGRYWDSVRSNFV